MEPIVFLIILKLRGHLIHCRLVLQMDLCTLIGAQQCLQYKCSELSDKMHHLSLCPRPPLYSDSAAPLRRDQTSSFAVVIITASSSSRALSQEPKRLPFQGTCQRVTLCFFFLFFSWRTALLQDHWKGFEGLRGI